MLILISIRRTISVKEEGKKTNNEFKQGMRSKYSYTRRMVVLKFVSLVAPSGCNHFVIAKVLFKSFRKMIALDCGNINRFK